MSQFPGFACHASPKRGAVCKGCRCRRQSLQPHRSGVEEVHTSSTGATACPGRPHRSGGDRVYRAVRIDLNLATEAVGRRAHRGAASSRVTTEAVSKNGATVRASLRIDAETTTHEEVRGVAPPRGAQLPKQPGVQDGAGCAVPRVCCATTEAAATTHRKVRARVGKERHKRRRLCRPAPRGGKPFETPFRPDGTPRWDTGKPATFRDAPYRTRPQSA